MLIDGDEFELALSLLSVEDSCGIALAREKMHVRKRLTVEKDIITSSEPARLTQT